MGSLLRPDIGLMVWTIVTFLVLVWVLGRFAWRPLMEAIENREERLRADLRAAEAGRQDAERLRLEYKEQMAAVEGQTRDLLARARLEGDRLREEILRAAKQQSEQLSEKTRKQLEEEERRLAQTLRSEVAELSVLAAEKLMERAVTKEVRERFVQESLAHLNEWTGRGKG